MATETEPKVSCSLNINEIIVALHNKALSQAKSKLEIQNTAIKDNGKEFTNFGKHCIIALAKDKVSGEDLDKTEAINTLKTYIQWFAGPDIAKSFDENKVVPLYDSNAVSKTDSNKKQTPSESILSFSQFCHLINEDESEENHPESNKSKKTHDDLKTDDAKDPIIGYYIAYMFKSEGKSGKSFIKNIKAGLGKKILAKLGLNVGIGLKVTSLFGGGSKEKKIGVKFRLGGKDGVFNKLFKDADPEQIKTNYQKAIAKKFSQSKPQIDLWDSKTVLVQKSIKDSIDSSQRKEIANSKWCLFTTITKSDPSFKLYTDSVISDCVNSAYKDSAVGIFNKNNKALSFLKGGVITPDKVIRVGNYVSNEEAKNQAKKQINDESLTIDLASIVKMIAEAGATDGNDLKSRAKSSLEEISKNITSQYGPGNKSIVQYLGMKFNTRSKTDPFPISSNTVYPQITTLAKLKSIKDAEFFNISSIKDIGTQDKADGRILFIKINAISKNEFDTQIKSQESQIKSKLIELLSQYGVETVGDLYILERNPLRSGDQIPKSSLPKESVDTYTKTIMTRLFESVTPNTSGSIEQSIFEDDEQSAPTPAQEADIRNYDVIIALPFDARSKNTKEKRVVSSNTTLFIVPLPTADKDESTSSDEQ